MPPAPKYLVEFFRDWIRDEKLRKKILFKEIKGMDDWGLSTKQSTILRKLDQKKITKQLVNELVDDLGIDLKEILDAWVKYPPKKGKGFSAGYAYDEGSTHVRGIEPSSIKAGGPKKKVEIVGHGWDDSLQVYFESPPYGKSPTIEPGDLVKWTSGIDVWQHATVKVSLPQKGKWRVVARVGSNPVSPESTEEVVLKAT